MSEDWNLSTPRVKSVETEPASEVQNTEVPEKEKGLKDLLLEFSGAPDEAQLDVWKNQWHEVYCSGMSKNELFVFRALTRQEFVELQVAVANPESQLTQLDVEEQIVRRCVLWCSPDADKSLETKAGTFTSLHEQIMQNSNFMNPAMAAALVVKL